METGAGNRSLTRSFVAIVFVAAACTGAAERSSAPMTALTSAPAVSPSQAVTSNRAATASPSVEPAETPRLAAHVLGSGNFPGYSVEAPSGWSSDGHFVVKSSGGVIGLSVWDVTQVPRDPCQWKGNLSDPGPTVDDLVQALVAQRLRNATTPTDVTLAGYHGQYLEWSVPADMVVTGDADFAGCSVQPSNGHHDFISWLHSGGGSRYQQVAGQVDRLWVLDVGGQRLVVDATYSPDTTEADRAELGQIAESLRFENP
jgi:hypothetical protein